MDCKTCANYVPKVTEPDKPVHHLGRIFVKDLRVGMLIKRYGTNHTRSLAVILEEPRKTFVRILQIREGYAPAERDLSLAASGLKPYDRAGWRGGKYYSAGTWATGAWCKEIK